MRRIFQFLAAPYGAATSDAPPPRTCPSPPTPASDAPPSTSPPPGRASTPTNPPGRAVGEAAAGASGEGCRGAAPASSSPRRRRPPGLAFRDPRGPIRPRRPARRDRVPEAKSPSNLRCGASRLVRLPRVRRSPADTSPSDARRSSSFDYLASVPGGHSSNNRRGASSSRSTIDLRPPSPPLVRVHPGP